jgi:putative Holliday junction resolvase
MSQIVAIDYGKARCGIAATDDLQIIASALTTVETKNLIDFLQKYFTENKVEALVIGLPTDLKEICLVETDILKFIEKAKVHFPEVEIHRLDERFTSKMASFLSHKVVKIKSKDKKKH